MGACRRLLASRAWSRVLPVVVFAMLLAGCQVRLGSPVSLFDDEPAIAKAVDAIQSRFTGPIPTFKVEITDDEFVVQAEDPRTPGQLVEWRLAREQYLVLTWDRVYGPRRIDPVLLNRNFRENLFDLKEIQLKGWGKIADAAIARAALEDKGGLSRVTIARTTVLLPTTSSGPPRWTFVVKSPREEARIYANASGAIIGADLAGTNRMRNLIMYQRPDLAADAAAAMREVIGKEPLVLRVSFNSKSIDFETTLEDKNPLLTGLRTNARYDWSLSGLSRTMGRPAFPSSNPEMPFAIDDVDWKALPKIVTDARAKLGMPNGRVTSIDLTKPTESVGQPVPIWKVYIEENRERGEYYADTAGAAKHVLLPPSRRTPTAWLNPETVAQSLKRISMEFGADTRIVNILINDRNVSILAEDPRKRGAATRVLLNENGFKRFGTPMLIGTGRPYTMNDLKPLTAERLASMAERTTKELKMPPGSVVRFTIGRGVIQASPKGTITVEVRAESAGRGHGWVVYELDGSVVSTMRP